MACIDSDGPTFHIYVDGVDGIVPASIAIDNRAIPLREIGSTLVLASDESIPSEKRARIAFFLNRTLQFVVRSHDWIEAELESRYRFPGDDGTPGEEGVSISWYWLDWRYLDGDKLVVKASGWMGNNHWTGAHEFPSSHMIAISGTGWSICRNTTVYLTNARSPKSDGSGIAIVHAKLIGEPSDEREPPVTARLQDYSNTAATVSLPISERGRLTASRIGDD